MEIRISDEITLSSISPEHAAAIFNIIDLQREYLGRWLPFVRLTTSVEDTERFISFTRDMPAEIREDVFSVFYKGNLCGVISIKSKDNFNKKCEIGYWLSSDYQKKGIITLSAAALCRHAFTELYMNRVTIKCAVGNTPSRNIPRRLGFTFEGPERDGELLADGNFTDLEVYSLLKREWETINMGT